MGSLVILLLMERARSEGARSTRAIEDQPGYPVKRKTSELGRIIWMDAGRSMREWRPHQPPRYMQVRVKS
jgi:hypothetical protein